MSSLQSVGVLSVARTLALTAHARDDETFAHGNRMVHASTVIGETLGCDAAEIQLLRIGAMLHDIGKCRIPDSVLFKPGRLDAAETRLMMEHSAIGHDLLMQFRHPALTCAAEIALCHHEHHDGSGYPRGLAGADIPPLAGIIAVTDVYDALRADRPYKQGFGHEAALAILTRGDDRTRPHHFDPAALAAFAARADEIRQIYETPEDDLAWEIEAAPLPN